jgi:hypothetical protein
VVEQEAFGPLVQPHTRHSSSSPLLPSYRSTTLPRPLVTQHRPNMPPVGSRNPNAAKREDLCPLVSPRSSSCPLLSCRLSQWPTQNEPLANLLAAKHPIHISSPPLRLSHLREIRWYQKSTGSRIHNLPFQYFISRSIFDSNHLLSRLLRKLPKLTSSPSSKTPPCRRLRRARYHRSFNSNAPLPSHFSLDLVPAQHPTLWVQ